MSTSNSLLHVEVARLPNSFLLTLWVPVVIVVDRILTRSGDIGSRFARGGGSAGSTELDGMLYSSFCQAERT